MPQSQSQLKVRRALLSVSNKENLAPLATFLHENKVEMIATGGTAKFLQQLRLPYIPIESITGLPEAFEGRMKTLSFHIGSSLLYKRDAESHVADAHRLGILPIDLVICNFYPFSARARECLSADDDTLIENIDIGGPTMIRAAAKNFAHVVAITSVAQYPLLMQEMRSHAGHTRREFRQQQALSAFTYTAEYESAIASELFRRWSQLDDQKSGADTSTTSIPLSMRPWDQLAAAENLRYGENPQQKAQFYPYAAKDTSTTTLPIDFVEQGKALSYNNLLDADVAWKCVQDLWTVGKEKMQIQNPAAVVIVKHQNPCGATLTADSLLSALATAWDTDPVSSFGSIIAFSLPITLDVAQWLQDKFIEVLVAPAIDPAARELLAQKKNRRLLLWPMIAGSRKELVCRSLAAGLLVQEEDEGLDFEMQSMTLGNPFPGSLLPLAHFGTMLSKYLKSNCLAVVATLPATSIASSGTPVFAPITTLLAAGVGQTNRVDCLRLLIGQKITADQMPAQAVLISDAFFPFDDSVRLAYDHGIRYIVQPGGSMRDQEVIATAESLGVAMACTGRRHFRH